MVHYCHVGGTFVIVVCVYVCVCVCMRQAFNYLYGNSMYSLDSCELTYLFVESVLRYGLPEKAS